MLMQIHLEISDLFYDDRTFEIIAYFRKNTSQTPKQLYKEFRHV